MESSNYFFFQINIYNIRIKWYDNLQHAKRSDDLPTIQTTPFSDPLNGTTADAQTQKNINLDLHRFVFRQIDYHPSRSIIDGQHHRFGESQHSAQGWCIFVGETMAVANTRSSGDVLGAPKTPPFWSTRVRRCRGRYIFGCHFILLKILYMLRIELRDISNIRSFSHGELWWWY